MITASMRSMSPRRIRPPQDALAGVPADIGVEQVDRRVTQRVDLDEARERPADGVERREVGVVEAAGSGGGPADRIDLAAGERQRLDQVVAHALGAQLLDDRVVLRAISSLDPQADRLRRREHDPHRAAVVGLALEHGVVGVGDHHLLARAPEQALAHDVGVERAHEDRDPMQRQAARHQPLAQLGEHVLRRARATGAVDQPVDHGARIVVTGRSVGHARSIRPRRIAKSALGRCSAQAALARTLLDGPSPMADQGRLPMTLRRLALVALAPGAMTACALAPPDDLAREVNRYYAAHASEENGACQHPEIASVTERARAGRPGHGTLHLLRAERGGDRLARACSTSRSTAPAPASGSSRSSAASSAWR